MRACDLVACAPDPSHGRTDRAVGRSPAEHECPRIPVDIVDLELRDVGGDVRDLLGTQTDHPVVVVGVVGDGAGDVRLLEPADPVGKPRGARHGPGARERLRISQIRMEGISLVRRRRERGRDRRQPGDIGDQPWFGAVGEGRIRQEVDGGSVLERDPGRLDCGMEALRGARGGDHRHRALAVAAVENEQQVGLLGLRRHAGRRPCALDVEDEQRQLEHHAETHHLRLEHDSRPGGGRDSERAAEGRTECRAAGCDLVLGLERRHPEALVTRQLLEDRRCRRDRVGTEEEREPGELRRGDQPVADRGVAGDLPVAARRELRRGDLVRDREVLGGLAVVVARFERAGVRLGDRRPLAELLLDERQRALGRPVIEPQHQAEREEVLRPLRFARRDPVDRLQRLDRHRGERHLVHVEAPERAVGERAHLVARLLEVSLGEGVGVDDQHPTLRHVGEVRLESGGIHGHEDVRLVAGREDVVVGEVHLKAGDTRQGAGRRSDLGREVRERCEVVTHQCGLAREPVARQLHTVAGVTGEPDDHTIELFDRLGAHWARLRIRRSNGTACRSDTVGSNTLHRTDRSFSARSRIRSRGSLDRTQTPEGAGAATSCKISNPLTRIPRSHENP